MKLGDLIWLAVFAAASLQLMLPEAHDLLREAASAHRYLTGLVAFALMGTLGETLAGRFAGRGYPSPSLLAASAAMWGLHGLALAVIFWVFNGGVALAQATGLLPGGGFGSFSSPLRGFFTSFFFTEPFFTSLLVNFGPVPVLLALQRLGMSTLVFRRTKGRWPNLGLASWRADWADFIRYLAVTLPLFRVPLLTLVFMLPPDLWLATAAWLGGVVGGLEGLTRRRKKIRAAASPGQVE